MKFESIENFVCLFEEGLIQNINATNDKGETYLMIACEGGFIDCARVLIERGAGVNLKGRDFQSALTKACYKGHLDIVTLLIAHNATPLHYDEENNSPCLIACETGNLELLEWAFEHGGNVNRPPGFGDALAIAFNYDQSHIVDWLLHHGYDLNYVDGYPRDNPLTMACESDYVGLAEFLLDQGADININAGEYGRDDEDEVQDAAAFPLFSACWKGHIEIVELLIERGADIHMENDAAFVVAAKCGHTAIVQLLLSAGSNIDSISEFWPHTALMAACQSGHTEVATLLLDNGADIDLFIDIDYATDFEDWISPLILSCHSHVGIMLLLIDRGADVVRDRDFALMRSCYKPSLECAKAMLEHGADPNTVNKDHYSVLSMHCNAYSINLEIVELLLRHGADVNHADKDGCTPLHRLLSNHYCQEVTRVACGRMLLECGTDVTIAEKNGQTALDLASSMEPAFGWRHRDPRALPRRQHPELMDLCEEYKDRNDRSRLALEPVLK